MKKERGGKPEIQSVNFEPAEGGLVSETRMKYKRGGQGGGPDYDYETERAIHPSIEHAAEHLREKLGHHFGAKKATKEEAPAEAKD